MSPLLIFKDFILTSDQELHTSYFPWSLAMEFLTFWSCHLELTPNPVKTEHETLMNLMESFCLGSHMEDQTLTYHEVLLDMNLLAHCLSMNQFQHICTRLILRLASRFKLTCNWCFCLCVGELTPSFPMTTLYFVGFSILEFYYSFLRGKLMWICLYIHWIGTLSQIDSCQRWILLLPPNDSNWFFLPH